MRAVRLAAAPLRRRRRCSPPAVPCAFALPQQANDGHTLYVNNLFEKCSQDGELQPLPGAALACPPAAALLAAAAACSRAPVTSPACPSLCSCCADLKKAMRCIFGQFGNILDVISRRTYRLRGQVSCGPARGLLASVRRERAREPAAGQGTSSRLVIAATRLPNAAAACPCCRRGWCLRRRRMLARPWRRCRASPSSTSPS